jgi:hypothetical protein
MFSIFRTKNKGDRIVVSESKFWSKLESECTDEAVFDAQGDEHSEIDMRLVDKIGGVLHPQIGDWESSEDWYHNLDYNGDGIRSLIFNWSVFSADFIEPLQALLVGEHEPFCILCQVFEDMGCDDDTRIGSVAIFNDRLLVSRPIAKKLAIAE